MFNLYNIIALTGDNDNDDNDNDNNDIDLNVTSNVIFQHTEIKGYAMLQFSYMMLKIYGKVGLQYD